MAGGNAIRGTRVGAGPMGESERGESAPRRRVSYWCANGHESRPSFAVDAEEPEAWDVRIVGDAAFARYLREAVDYAGGRRLG